MSREKGKRAERELAEMLRAAGCEARRGVQYQGGPNSPDVVCDLNFHIEAKHVEKLNICDAVAQAVEEAPKGVPPVVAHKRNRSGWLVTMRFQDWVALAVMARAGEKLAREKATVEPLQ